jgi:glycosyltransferase involved in cell wall biosynthesis
MANKPLVSIIVPTRNSEQSLENCLASIKAQSYSPIELIIVDRDSTDTTKQIAEHYHAHVYNRGPERSAQRNFGATKATGHYLAVIDSDMELTPKVIADCVGTLTKDPQAQAVIIPEVSFGIGFWAQCKALERSFYEGQDDIEAARFFTRATYQDLDGYDTTLVAGEDWDLNQRLRAQGPILRIHSYIRHNEGHISLLKTLKKKYYYAQHAREYLAKSGTTSKLTASSGPLARYKLFLSHPAKLFRNPVMGVAMLFMKTAEYAAGGFGYILAGK